MRCGIYPNFFNADIPLGFATMVDALFETLFEAVSLRMRRQ